MKKISTLAIIAFFFCLSSMAQVVLGDINFSLKEGSKINPATGKITVTFPNVSGVADPAATNFVLAGSFAEGLEFDEVSGSFASGVTFDLAEFELQPATAYTLKIASVKVDGTELAPAEGYSLNFKTRGAERKTSWSFALDDASLAQIAEDAAANADGDVSKYIDITKNGAARYYVPACNYEEIMLPDGTVLPATEELTFKFGEKLFYVSGHDGNWADAICFNGNNQYMVIPDCQEGDVITFNANRATTYKAGSKYTLIQALNGAAIAPDGFVSEGGVQDSIQLGSSYTNFKFKVQTAGDITFRFSNCLLKSIEISESQEEKPCTYNIVAAYGEGDEQVVLKELVGKTEGMTGTTVKTQFPYWLVDSEGNAYQHSAISKEFNAAFELNGDTTFVMSYNKTDYTGVEFLSEGEDLPGAVIVNHDNTTIRSSMGKAGYVTKDTKLVTLQPGNYKIRAVLFDVKPVSYICTLTKGAGEENEIYLSSTADNWTETESDLITITEATDITLQASEKENQGVDVIMIYAANNESDGIQEVKSAQNAAVRKVVKNGQVLIETEAGIFNVLGVQMK